MKILILYKDVIDIQELTNYLRAEWFIYEIN
jgi:hypothetical protein